MSDAKVYKSQLNFFPSSSRLIYLAKKPHLGLFFVIQTNCLLLVLTKQNFYLKDQLPVLSPICSPVRKAVSNPKTAASWKSLPRQKMVLTILPGTCCSKSPISPASHIFSKFGCNNCWGNRTHKCLARVHQQGDWQLGIAALQQSGKCHSPGRRIQRYAGSGLLAQDIQHPALRRIVLVDLLKGALQRVAYKKHWKYQLLEKLKQD